MFKLIPITVPAIDLKQFNGVLDKNIVNEIDGNPRLSPLGKFAEAVNELLPGAAYRHIYQAFYCELPLTAFVEISNYRLGFHISGTYSGLMWVGIISGPFDLWKEFLVWATSPDQSEFVQHTGNALFNYFRQFPYFQDFKVQTGRNGVQLMLKG